MNRKNILDLQRFTDGAVNQEPQQEPKPEPKAMTQEEIDKIVAERVSRETEKNKKELLELQKKLEEQDKRKDFAKLTEDERESKERELQIEKYEKERAELNLKLEEYEKKTRCSDILTQYTKDSLPCADKFISISELLSAISSDEERVKIYNSIKEYVSSVVEDTKKSLTKAKETPSGSSTSSSTGEENPFLTGNITAQSLLWQTDREKALKFQTEAKTIKK